MIALGIAAGPRRERRSAGYTSTLVAAAEAAAGGAGVASATAAVETAAGLWARGLALATVEPMSRRTAALRPSLLALIGRALCRHGEVVFDLRVAGGRVELLPASSAYVVQGGPRPSTWLYTVTLDGAGRTETHWRPRAAVAHLQYAVDPARPWRGRPPWAAAGLSGMLLAGVERQLAGEAGGPSGYVLPVPDVGDQSRDPAASETDQEDADPLAELRRDLAAAHGRTVVAPTTSAGYGAGPAAAPERDFMTRRFGLHPPETAVELRRDVGRDVLAACGVHPTLAAHNAPGTSLRESWRQLRDGTLEPLCRLAGDQLSEALGETVTLAMPRASDIITQARAVLALAQAGVETDRALEAVGL